MLLLRLSGHSGAGKSRLTDALPNYGIKCPRSVLYTSRLAREGEVHGNDYYFLSRSAIKAFKKEDFYVGPVLEMLQAVDLNQLEQDLKKSDLVIIEIFHTLWPGLKKHITKRIGDDLRTVSVFMTAIDPDFLHSLPSDEARAQHIRDEVSNILSARGKDDTTTINKRSDSAVQEILAAIGHDGIKQYRKVFHSAPEGPDGDDEWTREEEPTGRARKVLDDFIVFVREFRSE